MPQSTISIGQTNQDQVGYCNLCKANVRAYWVRKDGVPIVAICPERGHNEPLKIGERKLVW